MIVIGRDQTARAARAGHRAGGEQLREVDSGAVPRHRYRPRRDRDRDRQFRRAYERIEETSMRESIRCAEAADRTHGAAHAGRLLRRRHRRQRHHDEARDRRRCRAPRSTAPIRASLAYETRDRRGAATRTARNWKVDAHVERDADGGATVQVDARDASGTPLTGLKFQRPAGAADRQAGRSRRRARRSRHRHLSRQRRRRRAGTMGSRDRGRGARARALFLSRNRVILN